MSTKEQFLAALPDEDRVAITSVLQQWKANGVENPLLPLNIDIDGDGICDAWSLDAFGELILVSNIHVDDTVSASEGGGVETEGEVL